MAGGFASRVDHLLAGFAEADGRLRARLASATDAEAVAAPPSGGWTAAQIGHHVAAFNATIAALVTGEAPHARPAAADFVERPWPQIMTVLTDRFVAPPDLTPEAGVSRAESLAALEAAAVRVAAAFRGLPEARAGYTIRHPRVGTITVLQTGDWIVAHTIRHNAQMKRVLGR
jgi:DinB superfamily